MASVESRLSALGFRVHRGEPQDGPELSGRYWWTFCHPSFSDIETQEGDSATAAEAWLDALDFVCRVAEFNLEQQAAQDDGDEDRHDDAAMNDDGIELDEVEDEDVTAQLLAVPPELLTQSIYASHEGA